MKILHIANFYGPKSGGIRTTLHELGAGYIAKGHEFTYIVPGTGLYCEDTPDGRKITVPSFELPFSGGYRIIRNNSYIKKLIITLAPDVLEVSDRFTLTGIGEWASKRKIKTVVFSHETLVGLAAHYFTFPITPLIDWHNRRLAKRFNYVIATTNFAAREFEKLKIENLVRVPLGVDLEKFSPARRDEELRAQLLKGSEILLVHCGRMSREKHPARSLETLKLLIERGVDARLVYVGIGPLFKKLRQEAKDLPVTFLGYIADRERLADILASADVSLAPGPIETFCLAALESLASGTPVVASSTSAVGEFLLLNGEFPVGAIANNNPKSFADSIQEVIAMRVSNRRLSAACQHQAENFPWSSTISLMLSLHGDQSKRPTSRLRAA
jgi:alpha-1,6-mannosyltransferase